MSHWEEVDALQHKSFVDASHRGFDTLEFVTPPSNVVDSVGK